MIKLRELNLRTIRKMTMRNRLQAINEVNRSALSFTMFSMMTPTQFAELFPRYYRERNPDIQGFMNALPTSLTAAQQKAREQQLAQTASGSATGSDFNARGYVQEYKDQMTRERSAHVGGRRGGPPPATLSPEQDKAFSYVQSGDMDVGSDIMKNNLGKLSDSELSSIGISKITKEGKEYYHYNKPEMTDEQATARLKTSGGAGKGTGSLSRNQAEAYSELRSLGLSDSGARAAIITMSGESLADPASFHDDSPKSAPGTSNAHGIVQWNTFRANRIAREFPEANGRTPNQMSLREQIRAFAWEAKKYYGSTWSALSDPNSSVEEKSTFMTRIYENPANRDAEAANRIARYGNNLNVGGPVSPEGPNGQYSREQIDKVKEQYANEQNQSRKQKYAEILQNQGINPETGQAYTGANNQGTGKLSEVTSWQQAGKNKCGVGARLAAYDLFGDSHFQKGLGGDGTAASLSRNNNFFQESGYYQSRKSISEAMATDPGYERSLPIGTVISSQGGNSKGQGHVQIKVGPNKWVSFFDQSSRGGVLGSTPGHNYFGYTVHLPNEKGLEQMQQRGFTTNVSHVETTRKVSETSNPYDDEADRSDVETKNEKKSAKATAEQQQKIPEGAHVTFDQKTGRVEQKTETKVTVSEKKPEAAKPPESKPAEPPKPPEGSHVTTEVKSKRVEQKPETKTTVTPPPPEKKAEVKPTPDAPKPAETAKVETPKTEPSKTAESKPTEKPKTPVPTAAKGGKFNADADTLRIAPIGGLSKGGMTDTAVLMAGDRPVSTLNPNRETVTTKNNQVSIQPVGKESKLNPPQQPQNSTPNNLDTDPVPKAQATPNRSPDNSRDLNMINDLLEMSKPIFRNVSSMRAFSRANFEETGSAIDWNHHSLGTPNLK